MIIAVHVATYAAYHRLRAYIAMQLRASVVNQEDDCSYCGLVLYIVCSHASQRLQCRLML